MNIIDFFKKHSNLAVYGAGVVAKHVIKILHETGISPCLCVVTEKKCDMEDLCGIHIQSLSECAHTLKKDSFGILIGVSEKYHNEVIQSLERFEIHDYLIPTGCWKEELRREYRPVDPHLFFNKSTPVSDLFGCDRGTAVDRYYIEKFLSEESIQIGTVQKTLEVGEDRYSLQFFSHKGIEHSILDYSKGMDLTDKKTLVPGEYDVFICTQVFNFIYDVKAAIRGAFYTLKNGGVLLATVAGNISPVSQSDMRNYGHFWGFTYVGIDLLMQEVFGKENVTVIPYGNALAATAFVQGVCLEELPDRDLLDVNDPNYAINIAVRAVKRVRK